MRLVADDETVVDVPPKMSAGRECSPLDKAARPTRQTRTLWPWSEPGCRDCGPVINDEQLAVLRILADRRRSLGEDHTRMTSQLHQLLLELIPGGAKRDLSAAQVDLGRADLRVNCPEHEPVGAR